MPKPVVALTNDRSSELNVAHTIEDLSVQLQQIFSELQASQTKQMEEIRQSIQRTATFKPFLAVASTDSLPTGRIKSSPMLRKAATETPADRLSQVDENGIDRLHKEMLMAVLDLSDASENVSTEQVKRLLINRNMFTEGNGDLVDELFKYIQPKDRYSSSFSAVKTRRLLSMPFQQFAQVVLMDEEQVLAKYEGELASVILLIRQLALSDDAREVVKAALDLPEILDLGDEREPLFDRIFDMLMSAVIMANAVCIGLFTTRKSEDVTWDTSQMLDVAFTVLFCFEMSIKMYRKGLKTYFFGIDRWWNMFDASIVLCGLLDVILAGVLANTIGLNASSLMVLRLVRIFRLVRLVRVVRSPIFREIKLMLYGIVGLARTLFCALIVIVLVIYLLSILIVKLIPETAYIDRGDAFLFTSLSQSMFTVFRCLMVGDCTSTDGTSVSLYLSQNLGGVFTVAYCFCAVIMNYGLGSLITALIVDSTLNAAKKVEMKHSLLQDEKAKTASRLHRLAVVLEEMQQWLEGTQNDMDSDQTLLYMSRTAFRRAVREPVVKRLLDELDIDEADQQDLFDALDADGNERLEIEELIHGVIKMKGKARKVDVVASRLMLQTLMGRVNKIESTIRENCATQQEQLDALLSIYFPPAPA
eukprot:TRINITY_DN5897_c0_g1_i2.p1 TRINITY_DN5897_c0_g1~~TRINITY_DN5897_c0_g1_i2.p1  ORF type:complete len:645 (+),score=125.37 TRINITY_DN5897_c0_g1_i2:125-2059(+)